VERIARVEDLTPGTVKIIPGGRFGIGVFNINGRFHALANYCPHMGGPLCLGDITGTTVADGPYSIRWIRDGEIVRCPWHGWEFDIAAGQSLTSPVRRIRKYPVHVQNGFVVVDTEGHVRE
jgi:nitrite reductase (NADH) small subunit